MFQLHIQQREGVSSLGQLAQWIARQTSDLKVPGSSPGLIEKFCCFRTFKINFNPIHGHTYIPTNNTQHKQSFTNSNIIVLTIIPTSQIEYNIQQFSIYHLIRHVFFQPDFFLLFFSRINNHLLQNNSFLFVFIDYYNLSLSQQFYVSKALPRKSCEKSRQKVLLYIK